MNDLAAFARAVAPELQPVPVYVVHTDDLPAPFQELDAHGMTGLGMDRVLQPFVRDWCGRGVGILVNAPERDVEDVALHELAHALSAAPPYCELLDAPALDLPPKMTVQYLNKSWTPADGSDSLPPWETNHGPRFIRLCAHLADRATRLGGQPFHLLWVLGYPEDFRPNEVGAFDDALAGEVERMRGRSIEDVKALPWPTAFALAWGRFYRSWLADEATYQRERAERAARIALSS